MIDYCDILSEKLKMKVRCELTDNIYYRILLIQVKENKIMKINLDYRFIKYVYGNFNFETLLRVIKNHIEKGYYTIIDGVLI